jgi:hypothetical protein
MDADPLIRFRGQRHVGGYQIRNDQTSGAPILTPVPARNPRLSGWGEETLSSMRRTLASMRISQETLHAAEDVLDKSVTADYQPPDALFRAFAELGTDTQIVAFANRYGLLGVEGKMTVVPVFTRKMEKDIEWTETVAIHGAVGRLAARDSCGATSIGKLAHGAVERALRSTCAARRTGTGQ